MADPTDPTDPSVIAQHTAAVEADTAALQDNAGAARAVSEVTTSVQNKMSSITSVLGNVTGVLNGLTNSYSAARQNMSKGLFSPDDSRNIALVTTALLGVRDTASQFKGMSFDTSGFTSPIKDMKAALDGGGGALKAMSDQVLSAFGNIMPAAAKKTAEATVQFGMNLLQSADNAIHMRDAVIQLAAASGNLDKIYRASGPNLQDINELMSQQSDRISNVAHTMNLSREETLKYYSEIGRIPGALTATIPASEQMFRGMNDSMGNSAGQVDMFTGAIALAKGTGRDFSDVVKDLNKAFQDYGLSGKNALNFSVNMSEVANNLNIDLQSVQASLSAGADTFKRFADAGTGSAKMAEGLADLTNEYAQALKNQGFSGNQAIEVAQNMTSELGKMSLAQKAFLSAQTGGPGGLMGAFQIEKDLREGKIESVFKKVRAQMQQQLGPIVSLQEATQSPAAAAQLARQVTMLQKGPLGQFARNDQEAYRILEAFKTGGGAIKGIAGNALKGAMDKGVILQDQSRTFLSEIRSTTERQLALTDQTNLLLAQQLALAAGTHRGAPTEWQDIYRTSLRQSRANAATRAETMTQRTATAIGGAGVNKEINTTAEGMTQNAGNVINLISGHRNAIENAVYSKAQKEIANIKEQINEATDTGIKAALQKKLAKMMQMNQVVGGEVAGGTPLQVPGQMLGSTLTTAVNAPATGAGRQTTPTATNAHLPAPAGHTAALGDINVHVTGYCIKCKQEIEGGEQVSALSPSARRTSP